MVSIGMACTIRCPDLATSISSDSFELPHMQMYAVVTIETVSKKEIAIIEKKYKQCDISQSKNFIIIKQIFSGFSAIKQQCVR